MTDKLYLMTEVEQSAIYSMLESSGQSSTEYHNCVHMLQSLPVLEGEPVAWVLQNSKDSHKKLAWAENVDFESIPLYMHPAPFTPITVEGEPVAYRLPDPDVNKKHHYFDLNEVEHVKHVLEALYTSPQPPTAIAKDAQLAALGEVVKLSEELGLYASPIAGEAP